MQLRITLFGDTQLIDPENLMLSEAEILEEFAGIDVDQLTDKGSLKKMRFIGHLLWLVNVRAMAADKQISLREAAGACPRDQFDVPLGHLVIEEVKAAAPKAATPATRTPPTGSSRPRKRSTKSASPRSAGSAST